MAHKGIDHLLTHSLLNKVYHTNDRAVIESITILSMRQRLQKNMMFTIPFSPGGSKHGMPDYHRVEASL